jgi:hypothetical protein
MTVKKGFMKHFYVLLPIVCLLFSCCKSNEKAYNQAFQRMKEKQEEQLNFNRLNTAVTDSEKVVKQNQAAISKINESVTVIMGEEKNLSVYNLVIKGFINKTNAVSLYNRMKDEGLPAVLVQNDELNYRIITGSSKNVYVAEKLLDKAKNTWPEAWILVRY